MEKPSPYPALQRSTPSSIGFNLVNQNTTFNSVFDPKPLDQPEATRIDALLAESLPEGVITKEQAGRDAIQLKRITAEIKAIGKQGIVLMGERAYIARELLKPYKDGTFSKWLESAFGHRKTGYNMLGYYELHKQLEDNDLQEKLKNLPRKACYALASRAGDIETKAEMTREYHDLSSEELVAVIQEKLPVSKGDKRAAKSQNDKLVATLQATIKKLQQQKGTLSVENITSLIRLLEEMEELIS